MNLKWIVQDIMFNDSLYKDLPEIIERLGYNCEVIKGIPWSADADHPLFDTTDIVIPYVTIPTARKLKMHSGLYLNEHHDKYHVYTSLMKLDPLLYLNHDAILTTYSNFKARSKDYWYQYFPDIGTKDLFIRPDSGMKIFTGCLMPYHNWEGYLRYLDSTSVTDESLIWISSPKKFWDETRFIICNNTVIDGSRYSLGTVQSPDSFDHLVEDKIFPLELWNLAKQVAACAWKPDAVFTADLCMTRDGPRIVEINSFACAGWYACDAEKIVKAVSEHTLQLMSDYA